MKRSFLFLSLTVTLLSACIVPPTNTMPAPIESEVPALPATASPTEIAATEPDAAPTEVIPNPKLPAASFESRTYINETVGFALDYPAGWSVNEAVVGSRGSQVQFLSLTWRIWQFYLKVPRASLRRFISGIPRTIWPPLLQIRKMPGMHLASQSWKKSLLLLNWDWLPHSLLFRLRMQMLSF